MMAGVGGGRRRRRLGWVRYSPKYWTRVLRGWARWRSLRLAHTAAAGRCGQSRGRRGCWDCAQRMLRRQFNAPFLSWLLLAAGWLRR